MEAAIDTSNTDLCTYRAVGDGPFTLVELAIEGIGLIAVGDQVYIEYSNRRRWADVVALAGGLIHVKCNAWKDRVIKLAPKQVLEVKRPESPLFDKLNQGEFSDALGDSLEDLAERGWAQFTVRCPDCVASYVVATTDAAVRGGINHTGADSAVFFDVGLKLFWRFAGTL